MTRTAAVLLLLLSVASAPSSALEWCVESTNTTRVSPMPQPDGRVIGGGYHYLTIIDTQLWDLIAKFRVTAGSLAFYGGVMDKCTSGWIFPHGAEDSRATCFSSFEVSPCYQGEGVWDTWTVGELQGVGGGAKTSPPKVTVTQCFC